MHHTAFAEPRANRGIIKELKPSSIRASDKINMLRQEIKTTTETKSKLTAWIYIWHLIKVDLGLSDKTETNRTSTLISFADCLEG